MTLKGCSSFKQNQTTTTGNRNYTILLRPQNNIIISKSRMAIGPGSVTHRQDFRKNPADCIYSQEWTFADMDPPLHPDNLHHSTGSSVPSFTDDTWYLPDFATRLVSTVLTNCVLGEVALYRIFKGFMQTTHIHTSVGKFTVQLQSLRNFRQITLNLKVDFCTRVFWTLRLALMSLDHAGGG